MKALTSNDETYAIVKHMSNDHPGRQPEFSFKMDRSWKTSLQRQIHEAIRIEETDPSDLMNSRSEWGANCVPRIKVNQHSDRPDKSGIGRSEVRSENVGNNVNSKRDNVAVSPGPDQNKAKRQREIEDKVEGQFEGQSETAVLQRSGSLTTISRQSYSQEILASGSKENDTEEVRSTRSK